MYVDISVIGIILNSLIFGRGLESRVVVMSSYLPCFCAIRGKCVMQSLSGWLLYIPSSSVEKYFIFYAEPSTFGQQAVTHTICSVSWISCPATLPELWRSHGDYETGSICRVSPDVHYLLNITTYFNIQISLAIRENFAYLIFHRVCEEVPDCHPCGFQFTVMSERCVVEEEYRAY